MQKADWKIAHFLDQFEIQEAIELDQGLYKADVVNTGDGNQKKVYPSPLDKKTHLSPIIALLVSQAVFWGYIKTKI